MPAPDRGSKTNMPRDGDETSTTSPAPAPHRFPVRVYYEDTDFSGVVYHASYLRFLERGRTEFLRALGIEHKVIFADGGKDSFHFVVRSMAIDFARPALMDDALVVETGLAAIGGASLEMAQRILRQSEVLVTAEVRIAFVAQGKARRLPQDLAERLRHARGEAASELQS
jgi:acyl-CoA thioester hydrolase